MISLPQEKRKLLLAFHSITGCDTSSQIVGIGKQKARKAFDDRSAAGAPWRRKPPQC